jgi:hypothetical protein
VEGIVLFVRATGSGRTGLFIVPGRDTRSKLQFHAWAWLDELGDLADANLSEYFVGNCIRVTGTIGRSEGLYSIDIESPEQLEMIDCGECDVPDACEFTD